MMIYKKPDNYAMNEDWKTFSPYFPYLYETHWSSMTKLYDGAPISVLEYIYLEFRKFVAHPFHTKSAVTENFLTDKKYKLPQPNAVMTSFDNARSAIKDFLLPLKVYDDCRNDCVIFTGTLFNEKVCHLHFNIYYY